VIRVITFVITILVSSVFITPSAQAVQEIIISETTHRLSDGVFVDDELALKLAPNGELGLLVYTLNRNLRSWQVDPATISEIVAMSNGYGIKDGTVPAGQQIAKDWLTQFIKVSKNEKISALAYGNPSGYWVDQLVKERLIYLQASGEILLESLLGRAVDQEIKLNSERQALTERNQDLIKYAQRQIDLIGTVVDQKELLNIQLRLSQLLNPDIKDDQLVIFMQDFNKSITQIRGKLKITKTKFTVTSSEQDLPITIINDFTSPVKLKLSIRVQNSKVAVTPVDEVQIDGNSKQQILLPVQVLASGESGLLVQLTNAQNKPVGYPENIILKLSVISPVATWITSGAAVLLFIAALVQSLRRARRRK
jgi:hypothetical protein